MKTTFLSGQKDLFTGGIFNFLNPYAVSEDVGFESRISQSSLGLWPVCIAIL
jgi:hypothetical protein